MLLVPHTTTSSNFQNTGVVYSSIVLIVECEKDSGSKSGGNMSC